jgi:polyhydroxyalkanoate synthase
MAERGYLEGSEMATTFNLLRANDLIWSFVVNNYLLGKDPFPFDLLYWNSDSTRMPAKMHTFYLRNMYIKNLLTKPGAITLAGEPIDLNDVKVPACFVSTIEDHIAPWKSTYMGAKLLPGPVKFILGGSGHIAGIVNPPAGNKYNYWTDDKLADTADAWLADATRHDGSWWPEWNAWVSRFGGDKVPARIPGEGKLKALEDAPGSYAKLRLDAKKEAPAEGAPAESGTPQQTVHAANDPGPRAGQPAQHSTAVEAKPMPPKVPRARKAEGEPESAAPQPRKPRSQD